ncbi:MAG: DUF1385 domain-containing protein [Actinobacteria bacterium]|nr:DUF1385 domain-containing protein [Actinomycetota bacterium]
MTLKIGGMALENGVMFQTQRHWSAAVRDKNGFIEVAGGRKDVALAARPEAESLPLVRGPLRMVDAVVLLAQVRRNLPDARLPLESPVLLGAVALSTAAISLLRRPRAREGLVATLAVEAAVAALSLAPAVVALRGSSLAAYHGAEHKSIGAYEDTSGGGAAGASKEHERCGSNLVAPLLALDVLGSLVVRRAFRRPPAGARVATGLLSFAGAFEILRWVSRRPGSRAARWIMAPGVLLQKAFATREPSSAQLEVAQSALQRLLELEGEFGEGDLNPATP